MGLSKYANRRDENEPDIVKTIQAYGVSVVRLDKPCDLLCGYGGLDRLVEVKMTKGTLTAAQIKFHNGWQGSYTIIRDVNEAANFAVKLKADSLKLRESEGV